MTAKNGKAVYLQAVTMIVPATDWIEIHTALFTRTDLVSNIVELAWLTRYPIPSKVIVDRENNFLVECKNMIQADYSIEVQHITS